MSCWISHRGGASERDPSLEQLALLYDELEIQDDEHLSVSVHHQSEWCLSAYGGGLLIWENVEGGEPQHMKHVSKEKTLELWRKLAQGDIEALQNENWLAGYG